MGFSQEADHLPLWEMLSSAQQEQLDDFIWKKDAYDASGGIAGEGAYLSASQAIERLKQSFGTEKVGAAIDARRAELWRVRDAKNRMDRIRRIAQEDADARAGDINVN